MSNLYDRADIYDVCSTPRDWRIIREHWEKVLEDDLPRTLLDVSVGSGNLTLPLGEVGVRLSGSDLSEAMLKKCAEKAEAHGLSIALAQSDFREADRAFPGARFDMVASTGNSLGYVENEGVVQALQAMDRLTAPVGRIYLDTRNWDQMLENKPKFYFYRPTRLSDGTRVERIQFWEYPEDGSMTFQFVFAFEKGYEVVQREVFEERYHPLPYALLEETLLGMGYSIEQSGGFPVQIGRATRDADWYYLIARKPG